MNKTIERYQHINFTSQDNIVDRDAQQSWFQEVSKLKAKYESLQQTQRHLLGEDLGPLNVKELQNLEKQLEQALAQARRRKTQLMLEQMDDLRRKERQLGDLNKKLKFQLEAEGLNLKAIQGLWTSNSDAPGTSSFHVHSQPIPLECEPEPVLQIGYQYVQGEGSSVTKSVGGEANFIQGWVL
ncbi:hypothetical protein BT93_E1137 [Corymbia citriodora subsp. variegata]|nr:hypothetical protein BT93_E1137 [Corymbia citriodora subsp. variegata]